MKAFQLEMAAPTLVEANDCKKLELMALLPQLCLLTYVQDVTLRLYNL